MVPGCAGPSHGETSRTWADRPQTCPPMRDMEHEHHAGPIHGLLSWVRNTSVLKRDHIHLRTSQVRSIFSRFLASTSQPCLALNPFSLPRIGSAEQHPL